MVLQESAGRSHQALHAANERRSIAACHKNRKLAATALMRLEECPDEWEDVALELILHPQYSWSQIARRLGVTRGQAVYRFRRLLSAAGVEMSGQ